MELAADQFAPILKVGKSCNPPGTQAFVAPAAAALDAIFIVQFNRRRNADARARGDGPHRSQTSIQTLAFKRWD
jgi:hypothetical protein